RELHPHPHPPSGSDEVAGLVGERRDWVSRQPETRAGRRERFRRLRELNELLGGSLAATKEGLRRELEALDGRLAANAILRRRDYSFCLYPEEVLRPFCSQFL